MNEIILSTWRSLMDEGTRWLAKEEYNKAEGFFSESAQTARLIGTPEILAFSLRLLATTRVKLGALEVAETGFREALKICEDIQNAKGMAEALAGLASVAFGRKMFQEAVKLYVRSINVYPDSSPPLRLGMLYSDLGQTFSLLADWNNALAAYKKAHELCHLHGYPQGEGELSVLIGEIYFRREEKQQAEEWLKKACKVFATVEDAPTMANALQYLAFIYYDQNKMELARETQLRTVALWLRQDIKYEASESCYFLSKIEQSLNETREAEFYLRVSIELYDRQDLGLAIRFQNLAGLSLTDFELTKAEQYYHKALSIYEKLHEDIKAGEIYETLASLADFDGRKSEALMYYEKAVELLDGSAHLEIEAQQGLASYYEKNMLFRKALETYWVALKVARENDLESDSIELAIQRISRFWRKKVNNKIF